MQVAPVCCSTYKIIFGPQSLGTVLVQQTFQQVTARIGDIRLQD